jgi:hypothetical protein
LAIAKPVAPAAPVVGTAEPAAPARAETAPRAAADVEACWRAEGGAWAYLGYAARPSCVAQVFTSCQVIHGRWGKDALRRYDGKLQARGGGLIPRWQTVGTSDCPAEPAADS